MQTSKKIKPKTMKSYWLKWTMEHYTFTMIKLTPEEVAQFSGAVKEYLDYEDGVYTFLSLKYSFPAKPKPGTAARPLGKDQTLQNSIFLRECKKLWRAAKETLREKLLDMVSETYERRAKSGRSKMDDTSFRKQIEVSALQALSIRQLKQWVEDDEDKKAEKEKETLRESQEEAKNAHMQFVKHKDG
jgi:hypothetical protein